MGSSMSHRSAREASPVAHGADVDVDEARVRIEADATATEPHRHTANRGRATGGQANGDRAAALVWRRPVEYLHDVITAVPVPGSPRRAPAGAATSRRRRAPARR